MSTDLVTFLRAQLDEDERWARNVLVPPPAWHAVEITDAVVAGLARRMLAEVDAKRRIMALHHSKPAGGFDADGWEHHGHACDVCYFADAYPCPTLKLLALPYANREGYDERWRP